MNLSFVTVRKQISLQKTQAICDLSCILSYIGILAMGNSLQTLTNMLFLLRDIKIQNSCREGCHFINALCHNATFTDDSNSFFLCYSFTYIKFKCVLLTKKPVACMKADWGNCWWHIGNWCSGCTFLLRLIGNLKKFTRNDESLTLKKKIKNII